LQCDRDGMIAAQPGNKSADVSGNRYIAYFDRDRALLGKLKLLAVKQVRKKKQERFFARKEGKVLDVQICTASCKLLYSQLYSQTYSHRK